MSAALMKYFQKSHVRDAIHVPEFVQGWQFCTDFGGHDYNLQYNDTSEVFQKIFNSGYPLRLVFYNGDVDTECSMFQAEYFIEAFTSINKFNTTYKRKEWLYNLGDQYQQTIAGYTKRFETAKMKIDLLTVKGSGHNVPMDRPGPALQVLYNFLKDDLTYNSLVPFSLVRQPLLQQFMEQGDGPLATSNPSTNMTSTTMTRTIVFFSLFFIAIYSAAVLNEDFEIDAVISSTVVPPIPSSPQSPLQSSISPIPIPLNPLRNKAPNLLPQSLSLLVSPSESEETSISDPDIRI
ncbi:unnamed protein product, partial [Mesorhabditis belari]|uniref:Serine carboxypeptidase n=1 Tax=Mesorhabditis belari TaxID=2138241 RepID=A0AAF3E9D9_9BILA